MKFLDQMDIKGKKLLIRVDYNVPLKDGVIQAISRVWVRQRSGFLS